MRDVPKQKLQERAKRFNLSSDEDKRIARANRFGVSVESDSKSPIPRVTSPKKLKARAEKFVSPVSIISKDEENKRKLRQSRFGGDVPASKLASRAERFSTV